MVQRRRLWLNRRSTASDQGRKIMAQGKKGPRGPLSMADRDG